MPERDGAVGQREQGVVAADADPVARADAGAALPHQDGAGADLLAAVALDAEPLGLGVAPVARAAAGFLVRHASALDGADLELGPVLPVADAALGVLPPPEAHHGQLRRAAVRGDRGGHPGAVQVRRADARRRALFAGHQQHAVERDLAAGLGVQLLDADHVAAGDAVLLAAGFDDCVHGDWAGSLRRGPLILAEAAGRRKSRTGPAMHETSRSNNRRSFFGPRHCCTVAVPAALFSSPGG